MKPTIKQATTLLPLLTLLPHQTTSLSLQPSPPSPNPQQHPLTPPLHPTFRDIQPSDLPSIVTLYISAFRPSAAWHYTMPEFDKYASQIHACLSAQAAQEWAARNPNTTFGNVITVPTANGQGEQAVAVAIWQIRNNETLNHAPTQDQKANLFNPPFLTTSASTTPSCPGINTTRLNDANAQTAAIERQYLHSLAPSQLYLNLLATHPSWDGHGFGARHITWGQEFAQSLGYPLTLLATPAGYPLYASLGFTGLKNATVEMLDGLGELWFEVMEWDG
ncbi:hypothetical protein Q7P37_005231 [Cladosporium fusiforme]